MHHHHGRPNGLWHIGIWLAAAGLTAPVLAAPTTNRTAAGEGLGGDVVVTGVANPAPLPAATAARETRDLHDTRAVREGREVQQPRVALSPAQEKADLGEPAIAAIAWTSVDDSALEATRGGFTTDHGLTVSLGIDRIVSINGDVLARTRIDIADLGRISGEQARQASEALSSVKLIQNGSANIYRPGETGASMAGMVIQNSLNNQLIRTDTVISSTVNSAGLLSTLNFHSTLQDALARAGGPN